MIVINVNSRAEIQDYPQVGFVVIS